MGQNGEGDNPTKRRDLTNKALFCMRKKFKARDKTHGCDVLIGFYVTKLLSLFFFLLIYLSRRSDHHVDFVQSHFNTISRDSRRLLGSDRIVYNFTHQTIAQSCHISQFIIQKYSESSDQTSCVDSNTVVLLCFQSLRPTVSAALITQSLSRQL